MRDTVLADDEAIIVIDAYTPVGGDRLAAVTVDEFSLADYGSPAVARSLRLLSEHSIFRLNLNRNGREIELGAQHLIHLYDGSNLASLLEVYPETAATDVGRPSNVVSMQPQIRLSLTEVVRPPPTQ